MRRLAVVCMLWLGGCAASMDLASDRYEVVIEVAGDIAAYQILIDGQVMAVQTDARYDTDAFGSSALILAALAEQPAGKHTVASLEIVGPASAKAKAYNAAGELVAAEVRLESTENQ